MVLKMLLNRSFFKLTKTNLGGAYPWRRFPGLAKDFISCSYSPNWHGWYTESEQ